MEIPHVSKHKRANTYGYNNKRWCKCKKCKELKERHRKMYECLLFSRIKPLQAKREVFYVQNIPTTQLLLRLFGVALWASSINFKGGWFRLFGYGLTWKHETEGLMFSERMGRTKYLKLGKWIIKLCA